MSILELQKQHPLFKSQTDNLGDFLMLLRGQKAYEYAAQMCQNKTVLEIGCNTGICTVILARKAKKVFALDLNEKALNYAKKNSLAPNIEYVLVDGKTLPHFEIKPEVAVFFQLIEHIENDSEFLINVKNAIQENGKIIMTTPNAKHRLMNNQKPWNPFHVREYTCTQLKELLSKIFPQFEIYGLFGVPEVQALEKKRVKQTWIKHYIQAPYQKITGYFSIKNYLKNNFGSKNKMKKEYFDSAPLLNKYNINSFFISKDNLEEALDFFIVISI